MRKLLVVMTICALTAVAADDKAKSSEKKKPAGSAAMMAPRPAPEARELRDFVGTWKSQDVMEKIEGMMPGGEGTSMSTVYLGPGGFSIIINTKSLSGPMANYRGSGIMAWDATDKEYKMVWVDSMTPGLVVETGQKEGNDIVMRGEFKMAGKTMKVRDVFSDRTPTSYTITSYMDDGSGEKKTMTTKLTKEEKPKEEKPATK